MADKQVRYTWRTVKPYDRDVVGLTIFKYEWEVHEPEGSDLPLITDRRSWQLILTPEPHWHEYHEFEVLLDPTIEINGLDIVHLLGPTKGMGGVSTFDLRDALDNRLTTIVSTAVSAVMQLEPAIEIEAD